MKCVRKRKDREREKTCSGVIQNKIILLFIYKKYKKYTSWCRKYESVRTYKHKKLYTCVCNKHFNPHTFSSSSLSLSLSLPLTKMILLPPPHHHHHSKTLLSLFLFLLVFSFSLPLIFPPCVFVDVLALALKRQYASPYIYS